ncbi:hypothetical protein K438DRAFT_1961000 [Mycena galopus ATCC 62051]|nr:hypothetical protein K438DRAFT_1961000 [Mycena galopus ATCC 62051]
MTFSRPANYCELFLRDALDHPHLYEFNNDPCPEQNSLHTFTVVPHEDGLGAACSTDQVREIHKQLALFHAQRTAAEKLIFGAQTVSNALADLAACNTSVVLPCETHSWMHDRLCVAKKFIFDLAADARMLPEQIEPWRIKKDYAFIYGTDLCEAESEDEHDDDSLSDLEEVRSNRRPEAAAERRTMRGIIYDMAHIPARHLRLEVLDSANMDLSDFDTALCDARRPYSLFSVFTQHYEPYSGSINLNGRGDILIYRAFGIHASECPQIERWQREALSSKEQEDTTTALLLEAQSANLLSKAQKGPSVRSMHGRVATLVKIRGETFLVTTNTTYVPEPVITKEVFVRDDMRYGVDDYTLWPQKFSPKYPHLAAIPRLAQRPDLKVMWWEPTRADFVAGDTITRGLGKLCWKKLREMSEKAQSLIARYNDYKKSIFPELVEVTRPSLFLTAERPPDIVHIYSGSNMEEKIAAMTKEAQKMAWCCDPFADSSTAQSSAGVGQGTSFPVSSIASSSSPSHAHSASSQGAFGGAQRTPMPPRSTPYQRPARGKGATRPVVQNTAPSERDKFKPLVADEMPGYFRCWTEAIALVDRTVRVRGSPQDKYYVLPEPALLASPGTPERRQMFLHNWTLVHAAMIYRATEGNGCLSSQEWRDILEGKAMRDEGQRNKRTGNNRSLRNIMAPVLADCGINDLNGYPVSREATLPEYSILAAKQIIWQVAEINFRFEFASLDQRASGQERKRAVTECFTGGMLFEVPLKYSKQGLAAPYVHERHPFYIRMARLMQDWKLSSRRPTIIQNMPRWEEERRPWTDEAMRDLEFGVARYYTQAFFELYGRAAVLPMWLEQDSWCRPHLTISPKIDIELK